MTAMPITPEEKSTDVTSTYGTKYKYAYEHKSDFYYRYRNLYFGVFM